MGKRSFSFFLCFLFFVATSLNAQSKPGFCGTPQFPAVMKKLNEQLSTSYGNELPTKQRDDILNSAFSNIFLYSPETLIRLFHTNIPAIYGRALAESKDPFVICKSLYGLLYYRDAYIPADLVLEQLDHSDVSVRGQALLLIGLRPQFFMRDDIQAYMDKEAHPQLKKEFQWALNRFENNSPSVQFNQVIEVKSSIGEAVFFKSGRPADKFRFTHSAFDPMDAPPVLASNIMPPVLDYDKELVFAMPRKSFGVGTENIHIGDDCAWFRDGTPVFAIAAGKVRLVISSLDWGTLILIEHRSKTNEYFCSIYGHLGETVFVKPGQDVNIGDVIGVTGMSYSPENGGYGSHLHFAIAEGRWQKPKFRVGFHTRVNMGEGQVSAEIVGFESDKVVIKHGDKFYGIVRDKDTLNDRIQWIKGYQPKEDGIKGWLDPFSFIFQDQ